MEYKVTEIFQSLQGEGSYMGFPVNFVRLAGCPVGCDFCDTNKEVAEHLTERQILLRCNQLLNIVVITGGEPLAQDLAPLCRLLRDHGYRIHLETSGWHPADYNEVQLGNVYKLFDWVTVSPKPKTYKKLLENVSINEAKWLIPLFALREIKWSLAKHHWLQPVNDGVEVNEVNMKMCVDLLLSGEIDVPTGKTLGLSPQLHKLLKVK
jgi:organic radical activating enzyme